MSKPITTIEALVKELNKDRKDNLRCEKRAWKDKRYEEAIEYRDYARGIQYVLNLIEGKL